MHGTSEICTKVDLHICSRIFALSTHTGTRLGRNCRDSASTVDFLEYLLYKKAQICDSNYYRYVGYKESNECIRAYFSADTVNIISNKVTELLMGVDPLNRPIIVPDENICAVMSAIFDNFRPATGDIYSRYNIPQGDGVGSYVQSMIDQTIEVITTDVRNNLEMEENNKKLTAWTTVYGDFNQHGLRQHAPIKIRNRRPDPMQFNMNY